MKYSESKPEHLNGDRPRYRWENIMSLPDDTPFYDLSTGKNYRKGMFRPLHKDGFESVVDVFQVIGTDETVYVPFLRRLGDGKKCSIGGFNR